jgi:hypothetical protein
MTMVLIIQNQHQLKGILYALMNLSNYIHSFKNYITFYYTNMNIYKAILFS